MIFPRERTDFIVIHCAATRPGQDIGAAEIKAWHMKNKWADIGYHLVIRRNGRVEHGRPLHTIGSHVRGKNSVSVGICLVGGVDDAGKPAANYTSEQWATLREAVTVLEAAYPGAKVVGHRDIIAPGDPPKACPSFEVADWLAAGKNFAGTTDTP